MNKINLEMKQWSDYKIDKKINIVNNNKEIKFLVIDNNQCREEN